MELFGFEAETACLQIAQSRYPECPCDFAAALNNQSASLSELGHREDALSAAEEAVTTYRQLAAARPRMYADRLVSSLTLLATALAALGRESEADEIRAQAAQLR